MKILLVEDDEISRIVERRLLEYIGHVIEDVADGKSAIARFEGDNYDLILLDILLPDMSGYEVIQYIRNDTSSKSNIPVIAVTGMAYSTDVERLFKAGCNGCVSKPIIFADLLYEIDRVVS